MRDVIGIEKITIGDLRDIFKCDKMSIKDAMPLMREFRDKHGLNDRQTLNAFATAKDIFGGEG
jgi:hypothetical protein